MRILGILIKTLLIILMRVMIMIILMRVMIMTAVIGGAVFK